MGRTLHAREGAPVVGGRKIEVVAFVETLIEDGTDAIRTPGGIEYVRKVDAVEMPPDIFAVRTPSGRVFVPKP
jgi:hypothetical protein